MFEKRFTVITDTSANLPTPWLREHDIELIPFTYCVNGVTDIA